MTLTLSHDLDRQISCELYGLALLTCKRPHNILTVWVLQLLLPTDEMMAPAQLFLLLVRFRGCCSRGPLTYPRLSISFLLAAREAPERLEHARRTI